MITVKAYAKINLTLDILGRRDDGYHDIMSVMQTISLGDSLTFELDEGITMRGLKRAGLDPEDNLMLSAARLLKESAECKKGIAVDYERNIPFSAGLGGGSSDAATMLLVLNELWGIEWPVERLAELAAELGSDVTFFLHRGTALVQGRGESVTPLPPLNEMWVVLLKPPIDIASKTKTLYQHVRQDHYSDGQPTRKLVSGILIGQGVSSKDIYNGFDAVAYEAFPSLNDYRQLLLDAGAEDVHLCGSGPALFTLAADYERGERIYHHLLDRGLEAYYACTV